MPSKALHLTPRAGPEESGIYIYIYPPTPAYSQSLGGEAPGTPQGEAVGQVFKPLGSRPASSLLIAGLPLLFLWASKSDVWPTPAPQPCPLPLLGSSQACLFSSYGLPKATLGILHRLQTLPRDFKPFPAPLAYSCIAALPASGGSLGREPWNVQPVLLWASKSDVRHFAPPSNPPPRLQTLPRFCPPPRLQTLPSAFGLLLHRSLACVRREPGERASGTCSPCTAAPAPLAYSCIATAALPSYRQQACPPQRLQTLPSAFGLLLHRSLALLFSAARRPASSLLMGFQKRR